MWLIDTTTFRLVEILDPQTVSYAILSHTWETDELEFQDLSTTRSGDEKTVIQKSGYDKVRRTCELASSRRLPYVWVDTCCINKTSSAELSEAINSMFKWYRWSKVCFAFISDLSTRREVTKLDWLNDREYRWFTRGWTLQELIAAENIEFYDQGWEFRGDKTSLCSKLSLLTGINAEVLRNANLLPEVPVGRKMSWAARRTTTRVEDQAYCLLGIFDVNMPMIYGEGTRAFRRLQEEIAKETNDLSLFAWRSAPAPGADEIKYSGILATSTSQFSGCHSLVNYSDFLAPSTGFVITNNGLRMESVLGLTSGDEYVMGLNCVFKKGTERSRYQWIGLYIHKTATGFVRKYPWKLFIAKDPRIWTGNQSVLYIPTSLRNGDMRRLELERTSRLHVVYTSADPYQLHDKVATPQRLWNAYGRYFLTMESPASPESAENRIYPLFIGFKGFNISHSLTGHICSCLLICGIFEDARDRKGPCAVVYTDQDLSVIEIFHLIKDNKDEASSVLLGRIRDFVISKHSADGTTLSWHDMSKRKVPVRVTQSSNVLDTVYITVSISPVDEENPGVVLGESAGERAHFPRHIGYETRSGKNETSFFNHYGGFTNWIVFVEAHSS